MASPFSQAAQNAARSSEPPVPDYDKPVVDVYRAGTASDVGLWIADQMSPKSFSWAALWAPGKPVQSNPAPAPAPMAQPAMPTAPAQSSMNSSATTTWGSWLWGPGKQQQAAK